MWAVELSYQHLSEQTQIPQQDWGNIKKLIVTTQTQTNWKGDRNTKQTVSGLLAVISSAYLAMMKYIAFSTLNRLVGCVVKNNVE